MISICTDTEKLYTQATQSILDKYGKTYTWDVKMSLMGLQNQQVSEIVVNTYNLPMTWEEYSKLQKERAEILMPHCKLMPGKADSTQLLIVSLFICRYRTYLSRNH